MSSEPYIPEGTTTGVRIVPPLPGVCDARAQIASGAGGRFALAGAKCERQLPARYGPAPEVPQAPGGEHPRRPLRIRDHPQVGGYR